VAVQSPTVTKPARMQWMKLSLNTRTDPVVQLLSFDDQRHLLWLMMMEMEGVLDDNYASDKIRDAVVAKALGLTVETALEVRARLVELRLIDALWKTCAKAVDNKNGDACDASHSASHVTLSQPHMTSAERTRQYRARQKAAKLQALSECDGHSDEGVTSQGVTSDALELELEQDIKPTTSKQKSVDKSEIRPTESISDHEQPPTVDSRITAVLDHVVARGCQPERLDLPDSRWVVRAWLANSLTIGKLEAAMNDVIPDEVAAAKCRDPIRTINLVLYPKLTGKQFDGAEETALRLRTTTKGADPKERQKAREAATA